VSGLAGSRIAPDDVFPWATDPASPSITQFIFGKSRLQGNIEVRYCVAEIPTIRANGTPIGSGTFRVAIEIVKPLAAPGMQIGLLLREHHRIEWSPQTFRSIESAEAKGCDLVSAEIEAHKAIRCVAL
jgi:hypothetical protein